MPTPTKVSELSTLGNVHKKFPFEGSISLSSTTQHQLSSLIRGEDWSKLVLLQAPISREKRCLKMRKNGKMEKAFSPFSRSNCLAIRF
ncbi:unnamed protein product [Linum tenue]|uniref:Uncharacterized protein n=1 Tax=Linum tenue TaxID=586396 RepID=A0AAV0S3V7_9ROSI|nr:unnamed protein product [Linum tenue]